MATTAFMITFWVLAAIAILLGIVISADEYITEKIHSSGSKGASHDK